MMGKTFVERRNVDVIRFATSPTGAAVAAGDVILVGDLIGIVQQTTSVATDPVSILVDTCIVQASIASGTVGAKVILNAGNLALGTTGACIGVVVEVIDASTVAFFKFEQVKTL